MPYQRPKRRTNARRPNTHRAASNHRSEQRPSTSAHRHANSVVTRDLAPRPVPINMSDVGRPLFVAQTQPGIGKLLWNEISAKISKATLLAERHITGKDDALLFHCEAKADDLLNLRTAEDIFVVAARSFNISPSENGIKQIHATVKSSQLVNTALATWQKLHGKLPKILPYRVVTRVTGKQSYPRKAITNAVADAIRDGWMGGQWRLQEDEAPLELWATLFGTELIVALRLSDATMRHRIQREVTRMAALRPVVAAAMVQLSEPKADDVFLDPMAGTGTIVAERASIGAYNRLIAGDKSRDAVKALTKNLQALGGDLAIRRLDATDLPFENGEISKIVVNLPFGKQYSNIEELHQLYDGVCAEWERVVMPNGLIVALAAEDDILRQKIALFDSLRIRKNYPITILGHKATIVVIMRK